LSSYTALIVDFGGVLTTPIQDSMEAFSNELGIEFDDFLRVALRAYVEGDDDLVYDFEMGKLDEEEFSVQFAQRLAQATGKEIDPERFVQRMFGGMRLEEGMLDAVGKARAAGFKTGLLSNSWGLSGYPRERLAEICDDVIISAEVGMRKPDPAMFELSVARLGVAPEAAIFVDDHPGHLKAAASVGMTTVLHRSPAQTITELEHLLGVVLS
jgi:putative hydrolase of the HAD superfamily